MYSKSIVLDFDGTIFRLFTNYDLGAVVKNLSNHLKKYGIEFSLQRDIFDAFDALSEIHLEKNKKSKILIEINEIIKVAEVEALKTGVLIEGFREFIDYAKEKNIALGIATNNSEECINCFIREYSISFDGPIIGRDAQHPERMKPSEYMLQKISKIMKVTKNDLLFVGDNPRDYACAKTMGCEFIGLTPTLKKKRRMMDATNEILIIDSYCQLIEYIETNSSIS